jgi:hypothetical protein
MGDDVALSASPPAPRPFEAAELFPKKRQRGASSTSGSSTAAPTSTPQPPSRAAAAAATAAAGDSTPPAAAGACKGKPSAPAGEWAAPPKPAAALRQIQATGRPAPASAAAAASSSSSSSSSAAAAAAAALDSSDEDDDDEDDDDDDDDDDGDLRLKNDFADSDEEGEDAEQLRMGSRAQANAEQAARVADARKEPAASPPSAAAAGTGKGRRKKRRTDAGPKINLASAAALDLSKAGQSWDLDAWVKSATKKMKRENDFASTVDDVVEVAFHVLQLKAKARDGKRPSQAAERKVGKLSALVDGLKSWENPPTAEEMKMCATQLAGLEAAVARGWAVRTELDFGKGRVFKFET